MADQLISMLADLRSIDADTRRELRALERRLVSARDAGTPWLARDAAHVLAIIDTTVWISVPETLTTDGAESAEELLG